MRTLAKEDFLMVSFPSNILKYWLSWYSYNYCNLALENQFGNRSIHILLLLPACCHKVLVRSRCRPDREFLFWPKHKCTPLLTKRSWVQFPVGATVFIWHFHISVIFTFQTVTIPWNPSILLLNQSFMILTFVSSYNVNVQFDKYNCSARDIDIC